MFSQGISHRTNPMRRDRTFHMVIRDDKVATGWRLWCSYYALAREDKPGPKAKLCRKCKWLADDAISCRLMSDETAYPFAGRRLHVVRVAR